jgi:hypothetical protein
LDSIKRHSARRHKGESLNIDIKSEDQTYETLSSNTSASEPDDSLFPERNTFDQQSVLNTPEGLNMTSMIEHDYPWMDTPSLLFSPGMWSTSTPNIRDTLTDMSPSTLINIDGLLDTESPFRQSPPTPVVNAAQDSSMDKSLYCPVVSDISDASVDTSDMTITPSHKDINYLDNTNNSSDSDIIMDDPKNTVLVSSSNNNIDHSYTKETFVLLDPKDILIIEDMVFLKVKNIYPTH